MQASVVGAPVAGHKSAVHDVNRRSFETKAIIKLHTARVSAAFAAPDAMRTFANPRAGTAVLQTQASLSTSGQHVQSSVTSPSQPGPPDCNPAVIIVDHGSRREASNEMLVEFVHMYRQSSGRSIVEGAHMEIAKPSIADALHKCVQAGATQVIIAPYFLSRGRHIQEDIPALVKAAQEQHSGLECIVAEPIGLDPLMAQLIEARVQSATTPVVV